METTPVNDMLQLALKVLNAHSYLVQVLGIELQTKAF